MLSLLHGCSHSASLLAPLTVELALLGDVLKMERIRVGLIRRRCTVSEHDYVTALAHCIDPFDLR